MNKRSIGNYWNKVLRIGPSLEAEGLRRHDVEIKITCPGSCQHSRRPRSASGVFDGLAQAGGTARCRSTKAKCIGCQFCAMCCPYNVRYLNEEEGVVEKCTLCSQIVGQGGLPQCVIQCGRPRGFFGDLDQGSRSFEAPAVATAPTVRLRWLVRRQPREAGRAGRRTSVCRAPTCIHLPNVGNDPCFAFILRNRDWKG